MTRDSPWRRRAGAISWSASVATRRAPSRSADLEHVDLLPASRQESALANERCEWLEDAVQGRLVVAIGLRPGARIGEPGGDGDQGARLPGHVVHGLGEGELPARGG